jgi:RNA polymerase sigma factor (sigma-70 family)
VLEHESLDDSTNAAAVPAAAPVAVPAGAVDPRSITPDQVEALYIEHRNLLLFIACRKFRVVEADAESLIQEVFLSLLQTCTRIENVRAWLVAAMCNASRYYWRVQGRTEQLPEDFGELSDPDSNGLPERFAMQMTMQKVLGYLQPRCRETLRLHYFEGRSAPDVARELDTTNRYAEKLIHNCLRRAREIYRSITTVHR